MSHQTLIVYSSSEDPVAACGAACAASQQVSVMHVDELLPFLSTHAWPQILQLQVPAEIRDRFSNARIINRVFSLSGTQLIAFLHKHQVDERWFHIRLQDLFLLGRSLAHDTGVRGVSKSLLPLNAQWFGIRRALPNLQVPRFSYAFGYERSDLTEFSSPLQKSVWSLFDWREERHLPASEADRHQFHVERPIGTPVIFYFLGDDFHTVHFPQEAVDVDHARIASINRAARSAFHSELGEVLLYAEGTDLRFYAFSPYLLSVASKPSFGQELEEWLLSGRTVNSVEWSGPNAASRFCH
ncbi:hypothetical protein ACM9XD_04905 [Xanthomonas sacchari]